MQAVTKGGSIEDKGKAYIPQCQHFMDDICMGNCCFICGRGRRYRTKKCASIDTNRLILCAEEAFARDACLVEEGLVSCSRIFKQGIPANDFD